MTWIKLVKAFLGTKYRIWIVNILLVHVMLSFRCLLFILTSKQVLHTPFASRNQFFDAKTTFSFNFHHKMLLTQRKNKKNTSKTTFSLPLIKPRLSSDCHWSQKIWKYLITTCSQNMTKPEVLKEGLLIFQNIFKYFVIARAQ